MPWNPRGRILLIAMFAAGRHGGSVCFACYGGLPMIESEGAVEEAPGIGED